MKTLLPACLLALSLDAVAAPAGTRLTDTQMDQISAGQTGLPSCAGVSMCGSVSITSSSSSYTVTNPDGSTTNVTINPGQITLSTTISGTGGTGETGGTGGASTPPVVITLPRNAPPTPPSAG